MRAVDSWSLKEKLALGCSVQRSGDQNWVSVSRAIKPYGEPHRPSDWFQPRNCAAQYSSLLEKVETPKRKRVDRGETEVPTKQIVVKLQIERIEELKKHVLESQHQYKRLKRDLECIYSGQWDDQIKEKCQETQAAMKAAEETTKDEERQRNEMYASRAAALSQKAGSRRPSASSQSNLSEADDTTQDSLVDALDVPMDEDSLEASLVTELPLLTLPTSTPTPLAGDAGTKTNPPPSPLLSHLLKSSHKSPYSLQKIKQEQEQSMKHEQQQVEGGGSTTVGTAQAGDVLSSEVTPSASLVSQQSDNAASTVSTVKDELESEPSDPASGLRDAPETVTVKQEVGEEATSQESVTSSSENSSDQKLTSLAGVKAEEGTGDSADQRPDPITDAEIEDDAQSDVEGSTYLEDVSIKEEPASPASSVMSNVSDTRSARRGRGRPSRGRPSQRVTRKSLAKEEKDDASSKHSEAEFTDDDTARESDDLLSQLANQSSAAISTFTESVPNSPASVCISDTEDEKAYKIWKKSIMLVWRAAANHKYANVFLHPVTNDIAPGYSTVVLRPMDMLSIKKSIESGTLRTTGEFQRDMMLMFTNAIMYNSSNHNVYSMAKEMYDDVMTHIEQYVSTQLMMQSTETKVLRPSRRGDDKEEDLKKRRSSIEQSQEGGKTKKRKSRVDE